MLEKPINWSGVNWNMWPRDPWDVANPGYVIVVQRVDGAWFGDFTQEAVKIPRDIGDRSFDSFLAGQTLTLQGYVRGKNMAYLRQGQQAMWEAWWGALDLTDFSFQYANTDPLYIKARLYQRPDMPETWPAPPTPPETRTFTFAVRADDPRVWKASDDSLFFGWQV